jgi:hypothetical protein
LLCHFLFATSGFQSWSDPLWKFFSALLLRDRDVTGCDSLLVFFTCSIVGATVSRGLVLLKKFQLPQPFIFCQPGGNLVSSK